MLFSFCALLKSYGQETNTFSFTGKVKDVELNYFLTTATVSLFTADSTLVSFQITDGYGVFSFNNVKLGVPYHIKISNIGYQTKLIGIKSNKNAATLDLGVIEMETKIIGLNEVSIGLDPVTMNGDTLEFNPAAFKLDSNAVLDDLLRKIPNVTVWNDGQITVNGREIRSLIVNGKPFFGTDFKVATQNLPKNIIQTIQVYKKDQNRLNPLDSVLEMNIKLKKGMETGFFGKISFGGGTSGRYEGEGNLNAYSRKMQISLIGASNNTNKIANDVQTLLANSTFKSSGSDLSYQSNFRLPGDNNTSSAGLNVKYDFVELPTFDNKNSVTFNHFYQRKNTNENALTDAITTREVQDRIFQKNNNDSDKKTQNNNISINYDYLKNANALYIQSYFANSVNAITDQNSISSINSQNEPLSSSKSYYKENSNKDQFSIYSRYNYTPPTFDNLANAKKFIPFSVSYSGNFSVKNSFSNLRTSFTSNVDGVNESFDRNRKFVDKQFDQKAELRFENIPQIIFGRGRYFLNASLASSLRFESAIRSDMVQDKQNADYVSNSYLTNDIQRKVLSSIFGINFSKIIAKRLTDRFEKNLIFQFGGMFTNIQYDHISTKSFQNLQRNYFAFIPDASASISSNIFGKKKSDFVISSRSYINIPQIEQLAPLIDSAQFYYLRIGNLNLSEERIQQFGLSYSYENLRTKNSFSYRVDGGFKFSNNKIIDSVFISPDGRQDIYSVNGRAYQSINGTFEIRKAIKLISSDLKLQGYGTFTKDFLPTFINNQFAINQNLIMNYGGNIGYGFNDLITVEFRENVSFYQAHQPYFKSSFSGKTFTHTLSFNYKINKKLFFNTNINVNENHSSAINPVIFNIWNAYLAKRFFKGNNGELKLSALDILRQNKNLINRVESNRFITYTGNTLRQYFLVALSYYPRSFGKKKH